MSKRILCVDDTAIMLRSMQTMLKDSYTVDLATSCRQALTQMQKAKPDLIFLDYEMPEIDGKTTLELIRGINEFRDIPVVFLTSMSDPQYIRQILTLNPAGYILKPANKSTIFDTISKILGTEEETD